jgi:hypothetical protein
MDAPTISELQGFTLESYAKLVRYLRQVYKITPFCCVQRQNDPLLILRHDIDFSPKASIRMAQIEQSLGIRSTYFVLLSSPFYNLRERDNAQILKQISRLGHEIGLHYSPSEFRSYGRKESKTLSIQVEMLEHLLQRKVYSIARHGGWDRDPFAATHDYINAYHPYFRGDLYIHDSCRAWTPLEGLVKLLNSPKPLNRVQLLTHPETWQDDKIDRETWLERFYNGLPKLDSTLKEEHKKSWLTDSLVLEYDRLMTIPNSSNLVDNFAPTQSASTLRNRLKEELRHYRMLVGWYAVNTRLGWKSDKVLERIRVRGLLRTKRMVAEPVG